MSEVDVSELVRLAMRIHRSSLTGGSISEALVLSLAERIVGAVPDTATAFAELERALTLAAQMRLQAALPSNTGDQVTEVLRRLSVLNDQSRFDEGADLIAAELARLDAQKARLYSAAIDQDILRRNAPSAARWLVERLKAENPPDLFEAIRTMQDDWYVRGRDGGLNFEAEVAIHLAHAAHAQATTPDQRGTALNDLGTALQTLGEREPGTARLEGAVIAYRASLEEFTRDRVPLDWARAQMNLGNALATLGQREPGNARLEQAVIAFRAALGELPRDRFPLDWAITQTNLGGALLSLVQQKPGNAGLDEAIIAFRAALEEITRERAPLDWATAQMNLGTALALQGQREPGITRLEQAVAVYRAALEEFTRNRFPLDWASTQMNLGNVLSTLGQREFGTAQLEAAVTAFRAALEEYTRDRVPLNWATASGNLAGAMLLMAERREDAARARDAGQMLREAEALLRTGGHLVNADNLAGRIPAAEALIARLSSTQDGSA